MDEKYFEEELEKKVQLQNSLIQQVNRLKQQLNQAEQLLIENQGVIKEYKSKIDELRKEKLDIETNEKNKKIPKEDTQIDK